MRIADDFCWDWRIKGKCLKVVNHQSVRQGNAFQMAICNVIQVDRCWLSNQRRHKNKFVSTEEGNDQESIQSRTTYGKVTKIQEHITYKRATLSQQAITRLQGTDKTV